MPSTPPQKNGLSGQEIGKKGTRNLAPLLQDLALWPPLRLEDTLGRKMDEFSPRAGLIGRIKGFFPCMPSTPPQKNGLSGQEIGKKGTRNLAPLLQDLALWPPLRLEDTLGRKMDEFSPRAGQKFPFGCLTK